MTEPPRIHPLGFFRTPPHDCGYLAGKNAVTLFVDPRVRPDQASYTLLSQHGFRRSGAHVYRPRCPTCSACVPIRIPVARFKANRGQRRVIRKNAAAVMVEKPPRYEEEHFALYAKYIEHRHPGGGMEDPDPNSYMDFLTTSWADTRFLEFRLDERLAAVAVVDILDDGLSAVYTFFDPDLEALSLGRYAILKEIELTAELGLQWLYLGYWIEDCKKMSYKTEYQPHQKFVDGTWRDN
ncbi:MAG: arginyltransferase [Pseudomonadota bacterium]